MGAAATKEVIMLNAIYFRNSWSGVVASFPTLLLTFPWEWSESRNFSWNIFLKFSVGEVSRRRHADIEHFGNINQHAAPATIINATLAILNSDWILFRVNLILNLLTKLKQWVFQAHLYTWIRHDKLWRFVLFVDLLIWIIRVCHKNLFKTLC